MKTGTLFLVFLLFLTSCTKKEQAFNQQASDLYAGNLNFNPLEENVIASSVNHRQGTMSTLYGNNIALKHASTNGNYLYPKDAVLYMVTWKQRPDPRWFGANIPGDVVSVEIIKFEPDKNLQIVPVYHSYAGKPLKLADSGDSDKERIVYITHEKMSVIP